MLVKLPVTKQILNIKSSGVNYNLTLYFGYALQCYSSPIKLDWLDQRNVISLGTQDVKMLPSQLDTVTWHIDAYKNTELTSSVHVFKPPILFLSHN